MVSTPTGTVPWRPYSRGHRAISRRVGARYSRPLAADRIARYIDGRENVPAHGTREMPVWGGRFRAPEQALDPRIRAIVIYLSRPGVLTACATVP